jgi:deoxyribodipyrimidine photo-lyase
MTTTIVLFYNNFRLSDNPALHWALQQGSIVPVYIHDDDLHKPYPLGEASLLWLQQSLESIQQSFAKLKCDFIIRKGPTLDIINDLVKTTKAQTITWNKRYEPHLRSFDETLIQTLHQVGLQTKIHEGYLLYDPLSIKTGAGTAFKVFTPFSKACLASPSPHIPFPPPQNISSIQGIKSETFSAISLSPSAQYWAKPLGELWDISEEAAHTHLENFIHKALSHYKDDRDRPDHEGTSKLSPYLHFGQISPQQIWHRVNKVASTENLNQNSIYRYLMEILWREFSWHLLFHFPTLPHKPLVSNFKHFPWAKDKTGFKAWTKGLTGYPLIDAGMRQLWQTGWMHNRVRMVVASFLIKDLLIDWKKGADWFWDTLFDADLGSNSASWQWVAGCGADAAPFFRIFNPILQSKKFDPHGDYIKKFIPELRKLDVKYIHEPWAAPDDLLQKAGIILGQTYPKPIVDHAFARKRALTALASLKDPRAKVSNQDSFLF